jgi:hypothetical protein
VVDCTGLENRRRETVREFESHRFRQTTAAVSNRSRRLSFSVCKPAETYPDPVCLKWMSHTSVFFEVEFLLLVVFSIVAPGILLGILSLRKSISRVTVLLFGIALIALAGIDVALLQRLSVMVKFTPLGLDHTVFASELSIAFYLLPAVLAGIGINVVSHILIRHLMNAENRFDRDRRDS